MTPYFALSRDKGLKLEMKDASFFLGREQLGISNKPKMSRWRSNLFIFHSKNSLDASSYFGIPSKQVIEVGVQLDFEKQATAWSRTLVTPRPLMLDVIPHFTRTGGTFVWLQPYFTVDTTDPCFGKGTLGWLRLTGWRKVRYAQVLTLLCNRLEWRVVRPENQTSASYGDEPNHCWGILLETELNRSRYVKIIQGVLALAAALSASQRLSRVLVSLLAPIRDTSCFRPLLIYNTAME